MANCPVCGKILQEPGYEFVEFKHRCYTCTCGAHVILGGDLKKLKEELKKGKACRRQSPKTRKH